MGKKAYVGVSGKARNSKEIYVGVSNKARKVLKGYVGVNGKARQFWPAYTEYIIFKNGLFYHVPDGFDFTNNTHEVIGVATDFSDDYMAPHDDINAYTKTNKMIWRHSSDITRRWIIHNGAIKLDFIYDYDIPFSLNDINIPCWSGDFDSGERIPVNKNKALLKITGFGYFKIRPIINVRDSGSYMYYDNGRPLVFNSDTIETKTLTLNNVYIDRIEISNFRYFKEYGINYDKPNEWLYSLDMDMPSPIGGGNTENNGVFVYGFNKLKLLTDLNKQKIELERVTSTSQVYSIAWAKDEYNDPKSLSGGELLSKTAFSVHKTITNNKTGEIIEEITEDAEQIIYEGTPFYRYRYQMSGIINETTAYPFLTSNYHSYKLFDEEFGGYDGRLESEFFKSITEKIRNPINIMEISIIPE